MVGELWCGGGRGDRSGGRLVGEWWWEVGELWWGGRSGDGR